MPKPPFTLLDITNQLRGYFVEHTAFTPDEFPTINIPSEYQEERNDLILEALAELEDEGFIRNPSENLWILPQPIGGNQQELLLSLGTCVAVAEVINTFLRAQGAKNDRADAGDITETDIQMLLQIIGSILNVDPDAGNTGTN